MDELELLLADGIIDAVLGRLKSGKEADLWLVQHGGQVVAAKLYRDRDFRSFKNDAAYKEGRQVANSRTARALAKGSRFGREAAEQAWKSAEADALHKLHAHGVRTPAPVLFYEGVLLMELVLDAQGQPAPRLIDSVLTAEAAGALYRDLRGQVVRMLDADLIHGDLSPYNVLLGAAGPTIIDFPQVIAAAHNSRSESFFHRDLENLRIFFAGFDKSLSACAGDAREIWRAYVRRELLPGLRADGAPAARAAPRRAPAAPAAAGP
ncbi:MAG: RIO1 family regulatory kinase/ATPase [Myxococcales bacterium]